MTHPILDSLDHLVLTVVDIEATCAFYRDVLGMEVQMFDAADGSRRVALRFGVMKINLHEAGSEFRPNAAAAQPGTADLCFLTRVPLDEWMRHLQRLSIAVEEGPVARSGAQGAITSIYLRDPDDNLIELSVQSPSHG